MDIINLHTLFIVFFTYFISMFAFNYNNINKLTYNLIFFWHLLFCLIYYFYALDNPADANSYYTSSLKKFYEFETGAIFVINFLRIFSYFLELSYFNCFLIFNFIGTIGILFFCLAIKDLKKYDKKNDGYLIAAIIFLPTMHFWSSAIGKDAISFLSVCIFVWASLNLKDRTFYIFLSILLIFLVRPHIASIMLASLILSLLFYSKIEIRLKFVYLITLSICSLFLSNYAFRYVGMPDFITYFPFKINFEILFDFIAKRELANITQTGGIEISSMGPLMKIFTYLYRPLPYEAKNFYQLIVSLENIFLIFCTIVGFLGIFYKNEKNDFSNQSKLIIVIFIILSVIILGFTSANFGVNSRQKWMIFPAILLLAYQFSPNIVRIKK